jgi:exodeoxyribonuclease VII large subunit
LRRRLDRHRERLSWLERRAALVSPAARLMLQIEHLKDSEQRMRRAVHHMLNTRRSEFSDHASRLWRSSPVARVRDAAARHAALIVRLQAAGLERVRNARERLLPLVRTLNAVSPLATLERGYAIVTNERGEILRDTAQAAPGTIVEARLAKGRLRAKVENL